MFDNGDRSTQWRFKPKSDKVLTARFAFAGEMGSAEDDAFLWSMADLMTLLLVFFVLLYSNSIDRPDMAAQEPEPQPTTVASSDLRSEPVPEVSPVESIATEVISAEAISAPNEDPREADPQLTDMEDPFEPLNREMMNGLKDRFSNDFYVRWDEKQPIFVLGERITFNIGDALLLVDAQTELKRIADLIASQGQYQIIVSGHTDDIAIHTPRFPSNWELSAARAASVAKFLASHGVAPQRLIIQGKSQFHPLVANTSDKNRRANRRVEIALVKGGKRPDHFE